MVRSGEPARTGSGTTPWWLIGLLIVIGLFVVFHVAAATASMFAGGQSPSLSESMAAVFDHPSNPVTGLPETAGATGWVYLFVVLYLLLIAAVVWLFRWVFTGNRNTSKKGDQQARSHRATYQDVRSTMGRDAAVAKAREPLKSIMISPKATKEEKKRQEATIDQIPDELLVTELGLANGKMLYGQSEDVSSTYAPARTGKSVRLVAPKVIDAPAACMTTSTRLDILDITAAARQKRGAVKVFDLTEESGWPDLVRWNPVAGAEDIDVARRRGKAWAGAQPMKNVKGGDWFNSRAGNILGRLLFTAAVSNKTMYDVLRWANDLSDTEPLELLNAHQRHPGAAQAQSYLRALSKAGADEGNFAVQSALTELLEPLSSPTVMDQMTCSAREAFDMEAFVQSRDTLYLIADVSSTGGTGPLVSMFASEVLETAQRVAKTSPAGRFWPPFSAVLDEAANLAAFPTMDQLVSQAGGSGIKLDLIFQDPAQAIDRWGESAARGIAKSSKIKYFFGGLGINNETEELSKLIGTFEKQVSSRTRQSRGGSSVNSSTRQEAIMTAEQIHKLETGHAMLQYGNQTPIEVQLTPYWKRSDGRELQAQRLETAARCGRPVDVEAIDWSR